MKKILFKDIASFRSWQFEISKGLSGDEQRAVSTMNCPSHFPVILIFEFIQTTDCASQTFNLFDKLEYVYIYIGDFPVKEIKTGSYVYQMVKTNERFMEMMNR